MEHESVAGGSGSNSGKACNSCCCNSSSSSSGSSRHQQWVRGAQLGSGSFGRVNLAVDSVSGELFAVKSVTLIPNSREAKANLRALENEISILRELADCPEIIRYHGDCWTHEAGKDAAPAPVSPHGSAAAYRSAAGPGDAACRAGVDMTSASGVHPTRNLHLELAPGGSVAGLLRESGACGLSEGLLRRYTRDVVRALRCMHARGIVHGDVKGLNILVGSGGAKLADFGTAWRVGCTAAATSGAAQEQPAVLSLHEAMPAHQLSAAPRDKCVDHPVLPLSTTRAAALAAAGPAATSACSGTGRREARPCHGGGGAVLRGSPFWMSPETVKGLAGQGTAVDIWSLGCTVLEMATGRAAWSEISGGLFSVLHAIGRTERMPRIPDGVSPLVRDFIGCCLVRDPALRWTAEQLLSHPFLSEAADGSQPGVQVGTLVSSRGAFGSCVLDCSEQCLLTPAAQGQESGSSTGAGGEGPTSPTSVLDSFTPSGASSVPSSHAGLTGSSRPGGLFSHSPSVRKRGFSPLGCLVLEKNWASKPCDHPGAVVGERAEGLPKRQRSGQQENHSQQQQQQQQQEDGSDGHPSASSSFPLLDLAILKEKLPGAGSLNVEGGNTAGPQHIQWPVSSLSPRDARWIVVRSPNGSAVPLD